MADLVGDVLLERRPLVRQMVVGVEVDHFQVLAVDANQLLDDFVGLARRMGQMAHHDRWHPLGDGHQRLARVAKRLDVVHVVVGGELPDGGVVCGWGDIIREYWLYLSSI